MEELFDILTSDGKKTGITKRRSLVHCDGDWHKAAHVWVYNDKGEILLQRRCSIKDSNPNMLDVSSAGHLSAGEESVIAALRELEEEIGIRAQEADLKYAMTLQYFAKENSSFVDNEFIDVYTLKTDLLVEEMKFQESEVSEIFFVDAKTFKKMIESNQPDLIMHKKEFDYLFTIDEIKKAVTQDQ